MLARHGATKSSSWPGLTVQIPRVQIFAISRS
jgi:hypothetical protein